MKVSLVTKDFLLADGRLNLPHLVTVYEQHLTKSADTRTLPHWISSQTPRGKTALGYLFRHCVLNKWGIVLDRKREIIDPRLKKQNQPKLLRELCGESTEATWTALFDKFLLTTGIGNHYQGKTLFAFSGNFTWAFDASLPGHLDIFDFPFVGMQRDIRDGGLVWTWLDHIFREDLGIQLYNPETGQVDCRLLPEFRKELAQKHGFAIWSDLEQRTGLESLLRLCPVSEGSRDRRGSFGKLLAWYQPRAFDPRTKGFFKVSDFEYENEGDYEREKNKRLIITIALNRGIPLNEFTLRITRAILLEEGFPITADQSVLQVFCGNFKTEIENKEISPEDLYAEIEFNGETASFKWEGKTYSFPSQQLLEARCRLAGKNESGQLVIYGKPLRRVVGNIELEEKFIVYPTELWRIQ